MSRSRRAFVPKFAEFRWQYLPRTSERRATSIDASASGFQGRNTPTASSRLIDAVAATIAVGTLSLCVGVTLALLSIKAIMALPVPT
jgi:hypothetical protein